MKKFLRSSGILVHPTSFPSPFGIGDLGPSAYTFVDYLEKAGQTLWQVLPIGPTSYGNSPYQSFSAFAGNSLFISPELLIKEGLLPSSILDSVPHFPTDKTDYGSVLPYKEELFHQAYANFQSQGTKEVLNQFDQFCEENAQWLDDYCLFVALKAYFIAYRQKETSPEWSAFETATKEILPENLQKDYYYGAVWSTWPEGLAARMPASLKKWKEKLKEEIRYEQFLQYLFFKQWNQLKTYANEKGVMIIGDIPIFAAYDSADVWTNPHLFYLNTKGYPTLVAGVPPDYFSATGQLWGNPLYCWDEHKKSGYQWWIARMKSILNYVDWVRIDHFRGFDEYWAIPFGDKDATKGKWCQGPGKDLFEAMKAELGNLPIIAEDLGIITDSVTKLRHSLGFPGMKVLQFAFDDTPANAYLPHNFTSTNAVAYTGTHDNDTTLGWYSSAPEKTKDFFRRYMNVDGKSPSWDLIRLAISSVATFSIFPIQDVLCLGKEARMNTPSTSENNWQFRYLPSMLKEEDAESLAYLTKLFHRKQKSSKKNKEAKQNKQKQKKQKNKENESQTK